VRQKDRKPKASGSDESDGIAVVRRKPMKRIGAEDTVIVVRLLESWSNIGEGGTATERDSARSGNEHGWVQADERTSGEILAHHTEYAINRARAISIRQMQKKKVKVVKKHCGCVGLQLPQKELSV
jgi:hypothetical protein